MQEPEFCKDLADFNRSKKKNQKQPPNKSIKLNLKKSANSISSDILEIWTMLK